MLMSLNQNINNNNNAVQRNIDQLFDWIRKVRSKKMKMLRKRQRNIRIEATLGHALIQAEEELKVKHMAKIAKLQENKKRKLAEHRADTNYTSENEDHNYYNMTLEEYQPANKKAAMFYPELSSLDAFMAELSVIKTPVVR
ncbi:uncharacterized protein LOC123273474 [Cotesia glomerata]|uniref:Uncharacterized protein n=1 Tax=Cotesia glomerata TaxID=32391 RepID=A0AAV7ITX1_COTGL|nr:uncharacterized protein LOC123273474 [Cotesia glomerata]KAH0568068.1 hypothetical protein KQX54_018100 [Cotesia glomerata]